MRADVKAATATTLLVSAAAVGLLQVCPFVVLADHVLAANPPDGPIGRLLLWPAPASTGGRVATLTVELAVVRVARDLLCAAHARLTGRARSALAVGGLTLAVLLATMLALSVRLTAVTVAVAVPLIWAARQGQAAHRRERAPFTSGTDAARFAAVLRVVEPLGLEITAVVTVCHRTRLALQSSLRHHHRVTNPLLAGVAVAIDAAALIGVGHGEVTPGQLAIFLAWPAMLYAAVRTWVDQRAI